MTTASIAHFESLFSNDLDPWGYDRRWYEKRKRGLLLASLPRATYRSAYEPACGNGALTDVLATRCHRLLASDGSQSAVALARVRTQGRPNVVIKHQLLPGGWPMGEEFDLLVLSEICYYLEESDFCVMIEQIRSSMGDGADLVACHWRYPADDRRRSSEEVHQRLGELPDMRLQVHHEERDFLLDVWSLDPASVAQRGGLA